jgi:hypothetical protein
LRWQYEDPRADCAVHGDGSETEQTNGANEVWAGRVGHLRAIVGCAMGKDDSNPHLTWRLRGPP